MFDKVTLTTPKQLESCEVDEQTLSFLKSLPGMQIHPLPHGSYSVEIPQGVEALQVASDPNGNDTWLYRFSSGQVLGHDTEGAFPESVWPAAASLWETSTPFGFALACYEADLAAGHIPPGTLLPNEADYEAWCSQTRSMDIRSGLSLRDG